VVGGDETVIVVVVCSLAIIAAGTSSIQCHAVAAAAYITYKSCTPRNHSVPEKKISSSKQISTKASPNFHFTTCKLDPFLYSKVFAVLFGCEFSFCFPLLQAPPKFG
jgi:hypothetical protein